MTGRKALFLIAVAVSIAIGILMYFLGADNTWHIWGVPTLSPFADLRDVLHGIDAARGASGSSTSPFGLIGGYPAIWAALGVLGINMGSLLWIASAVLGIYWISLFIFARDYDVRTAVCLSMVVFSPAAMLGYERGNLDLLIFSLLALALALDSYSRIPAMALITASAMLKIYPIVGLSYLLKESRNRFILLAGIGLTIFVIYAVSIASSIRGIVGYIPRGALFDYGTEVIGFHVFEAGGSRSLADVVTASSFLMLYLLILVVLYWSYAVPDRAAGDEARFIDSFRLGAAIYIATFIEGNSFNYRLIFLLFCVPQIVFWARLNTPIHAGSRITLAALIASCWGALLLRFMSTNLAFALDELANWTLFAGLLYLFFATLPNWLSKEIRGFFDRHHFGGRKVLTESSANNAND